MDLSSEPPSGHDTAQSRAARAALGWTLVEASRRASVSVASVLAAEGKGIGPASRTAPDRLRRTYEEAGVLFLDDPAGRGIRIASR